jgi:hypothetical protein
MENFGDGLVEIFACRGLHDVVFPHEEAGGDGAAGFFAAQRGC